MALREHDEKHIRVARENLTDVRDLYAVMTDLIHKNITKVSFLRYRACNLSDCGYRFARRRRTTTLDSTSGSTIFSHVDG